jgi:hypothetical protein
MGAWLYCTLLFFTGRSGSAVFGRPVHSTEHESRCAGCQLPRGPRSALFLLVILAAGGATPSLAPLASHPELQLHPEHPACTTTPCTPDTAVCGVCPGVDKNNYPVPLLSGVQVGLRGAEGRPLSAAGPGPLPSSSATRDSFSFPLPRGVSMVRAGWLMGRGGEGGGGASTPGPAPGCSLCL